MPCVAVLIFSILYVHHRTETKHVPRLYYKAAFTIITMTIYFNFKPYDKTSEVAKRESQLFVFIFCHRHLKWIKASFLHYKKNQEANGMKQTHYASTKSKTFNFGVFTCQDHDETRHGQWGDALIFTIWLPLMSTYVPVNEHFRIWTLRWCGNRGRDWIREFNISSMARATKLVCQDHERCLKSKSKLLCRRRSCQLKGH